MNQRCNRELCAIRTAFELSPSYVRAVDGAVSLWSKGSEDLYGYSQSEAIGQVAHTLLKTAFPQPLADVEATLVSTGVWKGELVQVTKQGHQLQIASQWVLQAGEDGDAPLVVEVNTTNTDRRRADNDSPFLAQLVESSNDAIASKNLNGIITSWNRGAEQLFGYSASEMIGSNVLKLFPPDLHGEERDIMRRIHRGERVEPYDTVRVNKAGKRLDISLTVSPLFDDRGRVVGASKIARDISARRALERAVRESEQLQRMAVEAGDIGIWSFDIGTRTNEWSPRAKEIFGLTAKGPTPSEDEISRMIHQDDREAVADLFIATVADRHTFDCEFRIVTSSGGLRWIHSRGQAGTGLQGNGVVHGAFVDVTRRKVAEEALLQTNMQLQQFAYAAAHDLQEPLRNIALVVQLARLRLNGNVDDTARAYLDTAVENAHRMEAMVRDLLKYSRMFGDDEIEWAASDAKEVVSLALKNLASSIEESAARVDYGELPTVNMPQTHLLQIFQNLIDNSIKHRGPKPPDVHIEARADGGVCRFSVSDNGLGIEPQFQQRVFHVFKRLRKRETPGTGVGLALCKRTVEHYGGQIWIESNGSSGSTFFFTVPCAGNQQ